MQVRYLFIFLGMLGLLSLGTANTTLAGSQPRNSVTTAKFFTHEVSESNLIGTNTTVLSHPLTNNKPNVLVYVVQNQFTQGSRPVVGAYVAVRYNLNINRWMLVIYGGNSATLEPGVRFDILVAEADDQHWRHVDLNPNGASTKLNHPDINGNSDAVILFTPIYDDDSNPPLALEYFAADDSWYIVAQDGEALPDLVIYNLRVLTDADKAFKLFAGGSGVVLDDGQAMQLDHPAINNNPDALMWYSPEEANLEVTVDFPTLLQYRPQLGRWVIVRTNIGDINGVMFNVQLGADYGVLGEELVRNGSFENPVIGNEKLPIFWKGKDLVKAKRVCNKPAKNKFFSATGDCAVSFKGVTGAKSSLKYTGSHETIPLAANSTFTLRANVSGKSLTGGVKVQAKLSFDTGSKVKFSLNPEDIHDGTYAYKLLSTTTPLTLHPVIKISVKVQMNNGVGTVLIDDMSLYQDNGVMFDAALRLPAAP